MSTVLSLRFEDAAAFATEYENHFAKGGAFVRTDGDFELRQIVAVEIELAWCGRRERLDAEIVHVVRNGPAGGGVAVQFSRPAAAVRERFAPYLEVAQDTSAALTADDLDLAIEEMAPPDSENDRRAAPRSGARVPAELATTQVSLRGRTRDISEGGVLLSVDGSDIPVGHRVQLALRDPETGETVHVAGRVTRHVAGEGTVAAVAVEFDDPGRSTLVRLVRNAHAREAERSARGISGPIEELGGASPIEMFGRAVPVGTLTLTCGSEEGVVAFDRGALRYARLGRLTGVKALARMLDWRSGRFDFHGQVDALPDEEGVPLEGALVEAARHIGEARERRLRELPPGARLRLDPDALERAAGTLGKLEQAVVDLVAARFTVRRLLDVIPESDAEIHGAIATLIDVGVVALED